MYLAKLMVELKLATSTGEARRLIDGGGVKINGVAVETKQYSVAFDLFSAGTTVQAGKRRWARLA